MADGARLKVAVIDDSNLIQERVGRMLASINGIDVVGYAQDVAGAIHLVDALEPDVVVLDVELADGQNSIDVLRHVVRDHPGMQVIALSNLTWGAMRDLYLRSGAEAYFDKSMEFEKARDWVVALLPNCSDDGSNDGS